MNRNAAILALAGSIAAGLLIVRWDLSDDAAPSPRSPLPATEIDAEVRLEEVDALPATTDAGVALQPEVLRASVERRAVVDETGRIPSHRNEPMRLVSGVVRDEAGRPVEDAVLLVTEGCEPEPGSRAAILASGQSDESGRFVVRTTVRPFELQVRASKNGYVDSPPVAFYPGASGVVLVLGRGGVVSGRLLLDRWMRLEDLTLEISMPPDARGNAGSMRARTSAQNRALEAFAGHGPVGEGFAIDGEGRFVATGIDASTVGLTVMVAGDLRLVVTIPDVAVRRADEPSDARLDPLDLRGTFMMLAVDVLDEFGNGLTGATVTLSDAGSGSNGRSQSTLLGGHAEFLTRAVPHDVEIESEGFRSARLDSVSGYQVVRLRKGIPVRIRVRGSEVRPAPPDLLAVGFFVDHREFIYGRDVLGSKVDGLGTLDDPHETTFLVASPGTHRVAWYLKSRRLPVLLDTGSRVAVDILDQDALQEFVLDLPEQAEKAWIEHRKGIQANLLQEVR